MRIEQLSGTETVRRQAELTGLLMDAVEHGAAIGFRSPLAAPDAEAYWQAAAGQVAAGDLLLWVALDERGRILGSAQLMLDGRPEARHRAEIQKLIVRRSLRGRGIGSALIRRVEQAARQAGRTLLYLDTNTGTGGAAAFCRRRGYQFGGSIPNFSANPDGRLVANAIFYKELPAATGQSASAPPFDVEPQVLAG